MRCQQNHPPIAVAESASRSVGDIVGITGIRCIVEHDDGLA
jgi:hypothetical protein